LAFKKQHVYVYRQNLAGMPQYNPPIHNIKPLEQNRKALRNNMTPAEVVLWKAIQKGKPEGRKFRRQHSVGKYVLDFYCPAELLAVELDGAHHYTYEGSEYDADRTANLQTLNITVLRFENRLVFEHLDLVLEEIKRNFKRD
jgi:very-short-patch-repair endonuclease